MLERNSINYNGDHYDVSNLLELIWPSNIDHRINFSNIEIKFKSELSNPKSVRWEIWPVVESNNLMKFVDKNNNIISLVCTPYQGYLQVIRVNLRNYNNKSNFDRIISTSVFINNDAIRTEKEEMKKLYLIPQRRKQISENASLWMEYLNWTKKKINDGQFSSKIFKVKLDENKEKLEVIIELNDSDRKKLRNGTKIIWHHKENSAYEDEWKEKEKSFVRPKNLGKVKGKILQVNKKEISKQWNYSKELKRIIIDLEDDIIIKIQRNKEDNLNNIIPYRDDFLLNSLAGDLAVNNAQQNALRRLKDQKFANENLGDFVFDYKQAQPGNTYNKLPHETLEKNLNKDQIKAIEKIWAANSVALIQGPPGTGKTTLIAELCYQAAKEGKRVLIASQTNLAVDNALTRLKNETVIRPIRLGTATEDGQDFVEENAINRWFDGIERKITKIVDEEKEIKNKSDRLELLYSEILNINKLIDVEKIESIKEKLESIKLIEEKIDNTIMEKDDKTSTISYKIRKLNRITNKKTVNISDLKDNMININLDTNYFSNLEDLIHILNNFDILANMEDIFEKLDNLVKIASILIDEHKEINILIEQRNKLITSTNREDINLIIEINQKIEKFQKEDKTIGVQNKRQWRQILNEILKIEIVSSMKYKFLNSNSPKPEFIEEIKEMQTILKEKNLLLDQAEFHWQSILNYVSDRIEDYNNNLDKLNKEKSDLQNKKEENGKVIERFNKLIVKIKNYQINKNTLLNESSKILKINSIKDANTLKLKINEWKNKNHNLSVKYDKWRNIRERWLIKIQNRKPIDFETVKDIYMDTANVVGATCYFTGKKDFYEGKKLFDFVVIDEVSKATAPELLMPMLLGKKVVLIGDHRQLPPMFRDDKSYTESDDEEAKIALEKYREIVTSSYFENAYNNSHSSIKHRLILQYRMHEQIMRLINQFYSDNKLKLGLKNQNELKKHGLQIKNVFHEENHVVWIDSSKIKINDKLRENYATQGENSTSRYNQFELDIINRLLIKLNSIVTNKTDIGVITFYGDQVKKLTQMYKSNKWNDLENINIRTGTVDRFQGAEREIIIVSLVGALKNRRVTGFVKEFRRINVAFSRAQKLLIIIGSTRDFKKAKVDLSKIGVKLDQYVYKSIINAIKSFGGLVEGYSI